MKEIIFKKTKERNVTIKKNALSLNLFFYLLLI